MLLLTVKYSFAAFFRRVMYAFADSKVTEILNHLIKFFFNVLKNFIF